MRSTGGITPRVENSCGRLVPGRTTPSIQDGVADGEAVRAEGARERVELLDAPVPEVAALVDRCGRPRARRSAAACPYGWRFAGSRRPWSAQKTPSGSVSNSGVSA